MVAGWSIWSQRGRYSPRIIMYRRQEVYVSMHKNSLFEAILCCTLSLFRANMDVSHPMRAHSLRPQKNGGRRG